MAEQPFSIPRSSGVLMHLTSLPGPHGCGDLGPSAYRFADFLVAAGQRWWQMLPVSPTGPGNSPYLSPSSLAGNPLCVSLVRLHADGLLTRDEIRPGRGLNLPGRVPFDAVIAYRLDRLRRAFQRFSVRLSRNREYHAFCRRHSGWLDTHALFFALKQAHGGRAWTEWDRELAARKPAALTAARRRLATEIEFHRFTQFQFWRQWSALRNYCNQRGIGLIGDIPIYVAHDSADVWGDREVFDLDRKGQPVAVGGVPPDHFSKTGQRWGNPLYRWDVLKRRGYDWWIRRLRNMHDLFDLIRIDHFIGFHRYYRIPAAHATAEFGRWLPGPNDDLFRAVSKALGGLPIIAEDLGKVTPGVFALRDRFGLPGMKILQYAFGSARADNTFLPHHYPRRCVVYTGTHDNDTTVGWYRSLQAQAAGRDGRKARAAIAYMKKYLGADAREVHWDLIRAACSSVADLAIAPTQDLLGLDSSCRMNHPGIADGNWVWRLRDGALTQRVADRLRDLTETFGRAKAP